MKVIDGYDLPDTIQIPDGYDMKSIPDLTRDNFIFLMEQHNKLVTTVNNLQDLLGQMLPPS